MNSRKQIVLVLITLLCGAFFISNSVRAHGVEHLIKMTDTGYDTGKLTIEVGESVVFRNDGEDDRWPASNIHPAHAIYPEFDPQRPLLPGESWEFTFDKPGNWRFHDHLDAEMTGRIIVVDSADKADRTVTERDSVFERVASAVRGLVLNSFGRLKAMFAREPDTDIEKNEERIFSDKTLLKAYVKKFGPAQTVLYLNELSAKFGSCHDTAHEAGRFAYELFGEKAFKECSAYCHSGCYHGATEAYFRDKGTANLADNLKLLCGDELNAFFSHQCIHGIGHGLMAWSDYDLPEALKSCDLLSEGQGSCWTGVFMENIVGGLAKEKTEQEQKDLKGHFSKYLNDDPHYPCTVVEEKYKGSCYFLQTSRMIQMFSGDFSKVAAACAKAPAPQQQSCFESMGRDVGGTFRGNPPGAIEACSGAAAGPSRIGCLSGAVQDTFWDQTGQDTALNFCKLLTDSEEKKMCYQTIFGRAPQVLNSKSDLRAFCKKAESSHQEFCIRVTGI